MTISDIKKQYAKSKRNTAAAPTIEIDKQAGTLAVTEHLIGGTTCMHFYKKIDGQWEYQKTSN